MSATGVALDHPQAHASLNDSEWGAQPEARGSAARSISDATLYRVAAGAGMTGALVLLVNAAKRSSLIATTDLTQLLAPLAEIAALGLVTGLFLAVGRRTGVFGLVAFGAHVVALASLEGIEVVINLVFSRLPVEAIAGLRDGPLGLVLTFTSLLFLVSSLAFMASLLVGRRVPRLPLALYALGAVPISLRAFVPEWALDLGLVSLAAGVAWLAGWMWVRASALAVQD